MNKGIARGGESCPVHRYRLLAITKYSKCQEEMLKI